MAEQREERQPLLPIEFTVSIDEFGTVSYGVESGQRLNAWHLWIIAELFERQGNDMHAQDQMNALVRAQTQQRLAVPTGVPPVGLRDHLRRRDA